MHYYKRNIGDYHKKAARLSILQHGVYALLMDSIYDREKFPTREEAIEWLWASSTEEIEAVDFVLSKFFIENNGVFEQKRMLEEIEQYQANCTTNKRIAMEREAKRKGKSTKRERSVNEAPPNQEPLTINQEPLPITSSEDDLYKKPKVEQIPYQQIVNAYHEICTDLPKVMTLNDKRKKQIKARWNSKGFDFPCNNVEFWKDYFNHVNKSDFLNGRVSGDRPFKANLEWITNDTNFTKILEGNYNGV